MLGASNNVVGGGTSEANTIAHNEQDGVRIVGGDGTGNRVLGNSIFSNSRLGIELFSGLSDSGPTPNDPKDPDTGPNNLQNKPTISSAITAPGRVTIGGNLNSVPDKNFSLRFFSNRPGEDEGRFLIGVRSVTTNANGNAPFAFSLAKTVQAGRTVTATATGADGTSEFSAPRAVVTQ